MNRVDADWLLAMTQVTHRPPLRVIRVLDREDNYDDLRHVRGGPFDQPTMRSARDNPWLAAVLLPRPKSWSGFAGGGLEDWCWTKVTGRGPTPLAAMEHCWARLAGYLMKMSELNESIEQVE